ncbi:MAG: hypothetical protein HY569_00470 [Candidatus Magasanikbacteria bacterium]|nr:hypothetical protein [Candidatus Magasanikbacteria bacterium]
MLSIGSCSTVSFVRRTTNREISFALLVNPEGDATACVYALLGTYVSGPVRNIQIEKSTPSPRGLIVEGCAEVEFPHALHQDSDSPSISSCSLALSGIAFSPSAGRRQRRRSGSPTIH